ncbi:DnaB-like helicase N-terminal domain-containing protein, partial [Pseudactinotalea sp.]|uniref:DnaB-like helicase N-terminal domain-containing protein n=1 Tax=Pseudactinotalea sp. TaxID=1926260 RepID=UPI003B3B2902
MSDDYQATSTEFAERAVIGAALLDPSAIRWAAQHVTEDDFSNATLGAVWGVLHRRWKGGEPVDIVSMDGALRGEVPGYQTGGVFTLSEAAPVGDATDYWAAMIAEGAKRRRAIQAGTRLVQNAREGDL